MIKVIQSLTVLTVTSTPWPRQKNTRWIVCPTGWVSYFICVSLYIYVLVRYIVTHHGNRCERWFRCKWYTKELACFSNTRTLNQGTFYVSVTILNITDFAFKLTLMQWHHITMCWNRVTLNLIKVILSTDWNANGFSVSMGVFSAEPIRKRVVITLNFKKKTSASSTL